MKKIIIFFVFYSYNLFSQNVIKLHNTDKNFIDTIPVIVVLHNLDNFEPDNQLRAFKSFMERKGTIITVNSANPNSLAYSPRDIKKPNETKIFYYLKTFNILTGRYEIQETIVKQSDILLIKEL